jgi:hypothetical protein
MYGTWSILGERRKIQNFVHKIGKERHDTEHAG